MSISKVLIIVDNQNCFISGGSYGGHENGKIDLNKLVNSINQVLEISNLIDANDSIILTRDYHPINHLSIGVKNRVTTNYSATHPSHCLNINSVCPRNVNLGLTNNEINSIKKRTHITIGDYIEKVVKSNINNTELKSELIDLFGTIPKKLLKQEIIGTNLSWLYSVTPYANIISELINKKKSIGISNKSNKSIEPKFSNITIPKPYEVNDKKFIELVKGQLCEYESYSAFNYHLKLDKSNNKSNNRLAKYSSKYITHDYQETNKLKDLSTGLFEYILETTFEDNIEITVCGLVGEICVINTIVEGLIMWNLVYNKTEKNVIFNYSLSGTLFTGLGLFGFNATVKQAKFFEKMIDYLNNSVFPEYKQYILFNVSDNNEYVGTIYYHDEAETFSYHKKLSFSNNL
jgi:nicotinamidase-related amidase